MFAVCWCRCAIFFVQMADAISCAEKAQSNLVRQSQEGVRAAEKLRVDAEAKAAQSAEKLKVAEKAARGEVLARKHVEEKLQALERANSDLSWEVASSKERLEQAQVQVADLEGKLAAADTAREVAVQECSQELQEAFFKTFGIYKKRLEGVFLEQHPGGDFAPLLAVNLDNCIQQAYIEIEAAEHAQQTQGDFEVPPTPCDSVLEDSSAFAIEERAAAEVPQDVAPAPSAPTDIENP